MNKQEFYELNQYCAYHYKVKKMLKQWKSDNHITERCIIHHRDDNDEVRAYNEVHYELWGFNEDGTFEYGKYIKFMTASEHAKYHLTGRQFSESHRDNLSKAQYNRFSHTRSPMYGQHHTDETKAKLSASHKGLHDGENNPMYGVHRYGTDNPMYGQRHTDEAKAKMSNKVKEDLKVKSNLYATYKANGGTLKWQAFRTALKDGTLEISKEICNDNNT